MVAATRVGLRAWALASFLLVVFALGPSTVRASTCFGTIAKGRLNGGVQLPLRGENFGAYSPSGVEMGRTYLHSVVRQIVLDAYAELGKTVPNKTYVYGETGFVHGGRIRPHRTHQNGTSVDFMVPVLDQANQSVPLPSSPLNRFGYGLEFDDQGRLPGIRIDFDAMVEHLYQLSVAARRHNVTIERVIFDPPLMEKLFRSSRRGAELADILPFMKARPWIRHDEHYHIDFGIPCLPLREYRGN
ncbi:replication initiation protein [Pseudoduganella albidiflava]|uniref:Replication initiation protein n=2 Tax=Pseudoduganella albidiflava TaxID=321983 RepID=A0ABX5S451_9BURK|nr:replication initiation protein [Pseudoduganella albidiflava]